jgi:hypothetical protein
MEFQAEVPIALMAVVTDPVARTVEVVDVDRLRLVLFGINYAPGAAVGTNAGNLQLTFAWGGYDSTGKFSVDPRQKAGGRSISSDVDGEKDIWKLAAFDALGNPLLEFNAAFFEKLLLDLPLLGRPILEWLVSSAWPLPSLALTYGSRGRVYLRTPSSPEVTGLWTAPESTPGATRQPNLAPPPGK